MIIDIPAQVQSPKGDTESPPHLPIRGDLEMFDNLEADMLYFFRATLEEFTPLPSSF